MKVLDLITNETFLVLLSTINEIKSSEYFLANPGGVIKGHGLMASWLCVRATVGLDNLRSGPFPIEKKSGLVFFFFTQETNLHSNTCITFFPEGFRRSFTEITQENIETIWAAAEGLNEDPFLHCRYITHLFKQAEDLQTNSSV